MKTYKAMVGGGIIAEITIPDSTPATIKTELRKCIAADFKIPAHYIKLHEKRNESFVNNLDDVGPAPRTHNG